MGTDPAVSCLAEVAIHAKHLIPRRETVLFQPLVKVPPIHSAAVFGPIIVDVVDGEKGFGRFATARAFHAAIRLVNALLPFSVYSSLRFQRTLPVVRSPLRCSAGSKSWVCVVVALLGGLGAVGVGKLPFPVAGFDLFSVASFPIRSRCRAASIAWLG